MGKNSQRRRAAKRRPPSRPGSSGRRLRSPIDEMGTTHPHRVLDDDLDLVVRDLVRSGWTPADLSAVLLRDVDEHTVRHVLDITAAITAEADRATVHPRWQDQLDTAGAHHGWSAGTSPSKHWARSMGCSLPEAVDRLAAALRICRALPRIAPVLPPPGRHTGDAVAAAAVDAKLLGRIRGLLGKAESTDFAEEAEALNAKAQELMTRYSIDRAMTESTKGREAQPVGRRVWLESPYRSAKALLVGVVTAANRCRAVHDPRLGCVTVVGHEDDLDVVEMLSTSLLVQASAAMVAAGRQTAGDGSSSTRSFRHAFLTAYAGRIGERLRESSRAAEATAVRSTNGTLVPILTARDERVAAVLSALFPRTVDRRVSVSNGAGLRAGRTAADLALIDGARPLLR